MSFTRFSILSLRPTHREKKKHKNGGEKKRGGDRGRKTTKIRSDLTTGGKFVSANRVAPFFENTA